MEIRNCFYKVLKLLIGKHWMVGLSYINLAVYKNKMVQLTTQERIWICIQMARLQNAAAVQRLWRQQWPGIVPPHPTTIRGNFRKYQAHCTGLNMSNGRSGRSKTARTAVNIRRVRRSLDRNGNTSSRRNGLSIPKSSFSRIIRKDLNFHPYVLIRRQKLRASDPAQRLAFCERFLNMNAQDIQFLDNLIISDEVAFSMNNVSVNSKRYHQPPLGNPRANFLKSSNSCPPGEFFVSNPRGPGFPGTLNSNKFYTFFTLFKTKIFAQGLPGGGGW